MAVSVQAIALRVAQLSLAVAISAYGRTASAQAYIDPPTNLLTDEKGVNLTDGSITYQLTHTLPAIDPAMQPYIMSARSRIVNRTGLLVSLALTAACAHGAGTPAGAASVYETRQGERIVITPGTIAIGTAVHRLTDCSDAEFFCAASEEIGFRISFPRRCPDFVWFPERDGPMQMLSMWPHGGGARYTNRSGSPFVYDWQNHYGLVMIVHDPHTDFAAHPNADPVEGPSVYERKSGPRLFACR